MSLYNNRHIDLDDSNDLFGTGVKAKTIQAFFEGYHDQLGQNSMFALYGEWGSGKSSVLKYLQNNLDKKKYKTLFFDTWEYEKDDNLPLSLLGFMAENLEGADKLKHELFNASILLLKSFAKGINVKLPSIPFEFSNKDFLESTEAEMKALETFHSRKEDFKRKFQEYEDKILWKDKDKKLLIFIDDIDRCEPENVLNLISAIKLFFTYGKRTLFLFALDEDAVYSAIQTKYNEAIKAEEYLEKVFDMAFYMPSINPTYRLIERAFPGEIEYLGKRVPFAQFIDDLFQQLGFNNPRHIKKLINKYQSLCLLKKTAPRGLPVTLIPDLLSDGSGSIQETLLTLYFILLYEYYPDSFDETEDLEGKISRFKKDRSDDSTHRAHWIDIVINNYRKYFTVNSSLNQLTNFKAIGIHQQFVGEYVFYGFLTLFIPCDFTKNTILVEEVDGRGIPKTLKSYNDSIEISFCQYLIKYNELFSHLESPYIFKYFFEMCRVFL